MNANFTHCTTCHQDKHKVHFSIWYKDTSKARRCNRCQQSNVIESIINSNKENRAIRCETETKFRVETNPKFAKKAQAVKARRDRIEFEMLLGSLDE